VPQRPVHTVCRSQTPNRLAAARSRQPVTVHPTGTVLAEPPAAHRHCPCCQRLHCVPTAALGRAVLGLKRS
jgi:hypothetical protein